MAFETDCAVIGAGVVGLAAARALALRGLEVVIVEETGLIGSITSARNSEVIHAGIYYAKDSLKARFCVEGRRRLYGYCAERGIAHLARGKLIVATNEDEVATLDEIKGRAEANGVDDLALIGAAEARALEPELVCAAALLSPSTGIIDSHGLMLSYLGEVEERGGALAFNSRVIGGEVRGHGLALRIRGEDGEETDLDCARVVNAAGLGAQAVARTIDGLAAETIPRQHLCKGNYFSLTGRAPFDRLIYPVPQTAGLGVHITVDLAGAARFGPDQEWISEIDYDVDPARGELFYGAIRKYYPALKDGALLPAYAGIRPKLQAQGEPARDFIVQGPADHGVAGLVNLYGIESPGLTSSLAIGDHVADLIV